jgi:glycogen debranching enzyme
VNNDYLLEVNEGADWMDCLLRSGRVLYDEVLFYGALKSTDGLRSCLGLKPTYEDIASKVKQMINLLFWPEEGNREALIKLCRSVDKDFETVLQAGTKPYYYAEIGLRRYDPRCDVYANTLAILFGVADRVKAKQILNFFQAEKVHEPFPVRVLHPPVQPTDAFRFWHFRDWGVMSWLQEPGNFQNGGIWPYVGGFYVILWPGSDAKRMLEKLACANKVGKIEWEFNEWLNLQGVPLGSPYQSWSAAMYILAYYSIQKKIKVLPQV